MGQGVTVTLQVKDDGSAVISKVAGNLKNMEQAGTQAAAKMTSAFATLKENWLGLTAATAAGAATLKTAWDFAEQAASFDESVGRLNLQLRKHGESVQTLIPQVQELTGNQLSLANAVQISSRALAIGFNPQQVRVLAELAEAAGDLAGVPVAEAMERIVTSIAAVNDRALKQIGIYTNLDDRVKAYAESVGKTTAEVTQEEKQTLLLKATMEAAVPVLAQARQNTEHLADAMGAVKARAEDMKLQVGFLIQSVAQMALGVLQLGAALATAAIAMQPLTYILTALIADVRTANEMFRAALGSAADLAQKGFGNLADAATRAEKAINPLAQSTKKLTDEQIRQNQAAQQSADFWDLVRQKDEEAERQKKNSTATIKEQTDALNSNANALRQVAVATGEVAEAESKTSTSFGGGGVIGGSGNMLNNLVVNSDLELSMGGLLPNIVGDPASRVTQLQGLMDRITSERRVLQERIRPENWLGTLGADRVQAQGSTAIQNLTRQEDLVRSMLQSAQAQVNNINVTVNGATLTDGDALAKFIRDGVVPQLSKTMTAGNFV